MTGYAFITYARTDGHGYVQRLGTHLDDLAIPNWYDNEIISGERWANVIVERLTGSTVVIVVMTPDGLRSEWVGREIGLAKQQGKPILPLRFYGEPFANLADLQYEDVRSGAMPPEAFCDRLNALLMAPPPSHVDPVVVGLERRHRHAKGVKQLGHYAEAIRILRDIVADRIRVLGAEHPDTLASRENLAVAIGEGGDHEGAVQMLRELVADRARLQGPDHPDTLTCRY